MTKWQVFRITSGPLEGMWIALQTGVIVAHFVTFRAAFDFAFGMARAQKQAAAMAALHYDWQGDD